MNIAIIGCGNMGRALAHRLSDQNQLFLFDKDKGKAQEFEKLGYGKANWTIEETLRHSEIAILAVKPQNAQEAACEMAQYLNKNQIVVSIVTGVSIESLNLWMPNPSIVRMMPNMAIMYGEGVLCLSADETVSSEIKKRLTELFDPLGKIFWVAEDKFNAVTSLTGSGPAFIFVIVEAIVDAAIAMGFSAKEAQELALQMMQGSLAFLEQSQKHPGELKWQITSPGGTTIAGIKKLEELGLRRAVIETFLAAYDRAIELSH